MRVYRFLFAGVCLLGVALSIGCDSGDSSSAPAPAPATPAVGPGGIAGGPPGGLSGGPPPGVLPTDALPPVETVPVAIADNQVTLTPENTSIAFLGLHTDESKPNNIGGFEKFTGSIGLTDDQQIESIEVDIDVASTFTANPKLTEHLKTPDFFDVNEHPTIKFASTSIAPDEGDPDKVTITGDLTLHGVTKEITIPATVDIADDKLTLKSEFKLDRTLFGMNFGEGQIEKEVEMTIFVGEKTRKPNSGPVGPGGSNQ
jgi:polyisoprenoid-binding protein YceI